MKKTKGRELKKRWGGREKTRKSSMTARPELRMIVFGDRVPLGEEGREREKERKKERKRERERLRTIITVGSVIRPSIKIDTRAAEDSSIPLLISRVAVDVGHWGIADSLRHEPNGPRNEVELRERHFGRGANHRSGGVGLPNHKLKEKKRGGATM
jgi:hypothetical protein